jgi:hypothetical protein
MLTPRLIVVVCLLLGDTALFAAPSPQEAPAPATAAAPAWKPFQEFGFVLGNWTGTSESGKRVGGAVVQAASEMDGNFISFRGMRLFPEQDGRPEETVEETGYFFYDRDKRHYVAHLYFSAGVVGIYDVEAGSGSLKLTSREVVNYEGAKSRITISRAAEGLSYVLELAPQGKEFLPLYASKLSRR